MPITAVSSDKLGTTYALPSPDSEWQRSSWSSFSATKITDHLYLGSYSDACNAQELARHSITRILNVAEECPVVEIPGVETKYIALKDHSDENIAEHFTDALHFMRDSIAAGHSVLVHCRFGVSRSATMVLAYLIRFGTNDTVPSRISYDEAFDYVKLRRPQISPNLGFVLSLHSLDIQENGSR